MKKQIFLAAAVLFTAGIITMSGCKKDDTTPPVITLTGQSSMSQNISDTYAEPGVSAKDDKDGDLTSKVKVTGSVSNGLVDTYTLKYDVSDAAGNAATEQTRTVMIKSDQLAGLYDGVSVITGKNAASSPYAYTATVAQSSTAYNKVNITNFAGLNSNVTVSATISGTTLTIASQSPTGMGDPGTVSGTGTVSGQTITSLNYNITYASGGADACSDTWSNKH